MKYNLSVRGGNIIKLFKAVDLLSRPGGATIRLMEEELDLSRRSVYRLLDTLQEMNFPLTETKGLGREKSWGLEERYLKRLPNISLPDLSLSLREANLLQLLLARDMLWKNTYIAPILDSIRRKLASFLPAEGGTADKTPPVLISGLDPRKDYRGKEMILETLLTAIGEGRVCRAVYHSFSAGRVRDYTLHPLRLLEHRGGVYFFAQVADYQDVRLFAVERLKALRMTEERFSAPRDFDPEKLLEGSLDLNLGAPVTARVRISPRQARYIRERIWSPGQEIRELPDGGVELRLTTSGDYDLRRWVLSMGTEATLLEPRWLAEEMAQEIEQMARAYGRRKNIFDGDDEI